MKKLLYFILIIISITLCGCWGYTDIDELNILSGVGFDLNKDNTYLMITEGISTSKATEDYSKSSNTNSATNYYSSRGRSIFDAARNLTKASLGKRNFYQTCEIIALGKNLCKTGITPAIDFFTRDPKRRSTAYPVLFDGDITDFFKKNHTTYETLSSQLISIIDLYKYTGYGVKMNLSQTISSSKSITGTVLLNKFKLKPSYKDKNIFEPVLDGTGILYQNKLIGYFDSHETMVANIISKQIKHGILVVNKDINVPAYKNITIEITKFKTNFIPSIENDNYTMNVDIKATCKIVEYSENESFKDYNYKELENLVSKQLNDLINKTYLKCKTKFKVDALGFGKYFPKKYKYLSKIQPEEWNNIFCNKFNLKLNVKASIINTGSTIEKAD